MDGVSLLTLRMSWTDWAECGSNVSKTRIKTKKKKPKKKKQENVTKRCGRIGLPNNPIGKTFRPELFRFMFRNNPLSCFQWLINRKRWTIQFSSSFFRDSPGSFRTVNCSSTELDYFNLRCNCGNDDEHAIFSWPPKNRTISFST